MVYKVLKKFKRFSYFEEIWRTKIQAAQDHRHRYIKAYV